VEPRFSMHELVQLCCYCRAVDLLSLKEIQSERSVHVLVTVGILLVFFLNTMSILVKSISCCIGPIERLQTWKLHDFGQSV